MDIVLVHGYNVTSTSTYGVLPKRLKEAGHTVRHVYLSKYVTLDNDLSITDIAKAFQSALQDTYKSKTPQKKFACITHSTGALVVREWIYRTYGQNKKQLPLSHLIMLAPPNNGSRLASVGVTRLNRLREFYGQEPGLKILDALEIGSAFQWNLNSHWMRKKIHATPGFYSCVITGQWIDKKIWDVVSPATRERGSDGVIRAAAANLNAQKITVASDGKVLREVMGGIPYLVTPRTAHTYKDYGIILSIPRKGSHPVLDAIVNFLNVNNRQGYQKIEADFALKTFRLQRRDQYYDRSKLHRYAQVTFQITDDMGNKISDYAIEMINPRTGDNHFESGFIEHKHKNGRHPEFFTFYLNYDKLAKESEGQLAFQITSESRSPMTGYVPFTWNGSIKEGMTFLKPNQSTLIKIVMKRRLNKKVFELTRNFNKQKIRRKPGPDWIE